MCVTSSKYHLHNPANGPGCPAKNQDILPMEFDFASNGYIGPRGCIQGRAKETTPMICRNMCPPEEDPIMVTNEEPLREVDEILY